MYSNICENVKCTFNPKTNFCYKNKRKTNSKSIQNQLCFCNHETGRCIKQKTNDLLKKKIIKPDIINIDNLYLTDIKLRSCYLKGFGWIYLKSLKKCYPLPPESQLNYGILKRDKSCIVYNGNYYFFPIEKKEDDLIIYLNNYKILIKSLKKCRLIRSK